MTRLPGKKPQTPTGKEPLDPWAEIAHEHPEIGDDGKRLTEEGVGASFMRLIQALLWRPISTIIYLAGLAYGSLCVYLFANNQLLDTYGEANKAFNIPEGELVIPPDTLIITPDGIYMLLAWLVVPPIWFLFERYVMFKMLHQRALVKDVQEISIKVWLAFLFTMVLLAKR
jgi:hypothetical protein